MKAADESSRDIARIRGAKRVGDDPLSAVDDCDEQQNVDHNYAVINLETCAHMYMPGPCSTSTASAGFTGGWGFLYLAVGTVRRLHVYTRRPAALYACLR